jgi:ADP-heptose:LPS heptosyltransferase
MTPVFRGLRSRFPDARITLLVGSKASLELFSSNPNVDETVVFDLRGEHRSFRGLLSLWRQLRGGRYDLVINFQRSNVKTWFLASAAFPCRVLVYNKSRRVGVHAVEDHFDTLLPLGVTRDDLHLDLFPDTEAMAWVQKFWVENGLDQQTVVALNLGASNRIKCWSPRSFAELADRLRSAGLVPLLIGGGMETDLGLQVQSMLATPCLSLVGKLSVAQLGAVLKSCDLLVSGDTGALHMATAVGTPVIGLFGAIDPRRTGPVGTGHRVIRHPEIPCVPCNAKKCTNPVYLECMERITVDEVFTVVSEMLTERGKLS